MLVLAIYRHILIIYLLDMHRQDLEHMDVKINNVLLESSEFEYVAPVQGQSMLCM
jgi:hypothetical protein